MEGKKYKMLSVHTVWKENQGEGCFSFSRMFAEHKVVVMQMSLDKVAAEHIFGKHCLCDFIFLSIIAFLFLFIVR